MDVFSKGGGNLAGPMEALNQHQIFLLDGGSEQRKLNEFYLKVKQGQLTLETAWKKVTRFSKNEQFIFQGRIFQLFVIS